MSFDYIIQDNYEITSYTSYIVDECGEIKAKASDVNVNEVLEQHPEWSVKCL